MQNLPNELIQDILKKANIDEIQGLCNSSSRFRDNCNVISKSLLKREYKDYYQIYLLLRKFSISITTNEGDNFFANTYNIKNIPNIFKKLLQGRLPNNSKTNEISWNVDDNRNPKTLSIHFHYYDDVESNFNVIISGNFESYKNVDKLVSDITDVYDTL